MKLKEKFKIWKKCDVFTENLKNIQYKNSNKNGFNFNKTNIQNIFKKNYSSNKILKSETLDKKLNISNFRYLKLKRRKGHLFITN